MTAPVVEQLDTAAARRLVSEARNALALADDLLARLYAGRAWVALGHADWPALCAAELPELRHLKLRAPAREARAAALLAAAPDLTVRDLVAATGASVGTAHATLSKVRGAAAVQQDCASSPTAAARPDLTARIVALLAEQPAGLDVFTVARRLKARQAQVAPALSRLAAAGRITYAAPAKRGQTGRYGC